MGIYDLREHISIHRQASTMSVLAKLELSISMDQLRYDIAVGTPGRREKDVALSAILKELSKYGLIVPRENTTPIDKKYKALVDKLLAADTIGEIYALKEEVRSEEGVQKINRRRKICRIR